LIFPSWTYNTTTIKKGKENTMVYIIKDNLAPKRSGCLPQNTIINKIGTRLSSNIK